MSDKPEDLRLFRDQMSDVRRLSSDRTQPTRPRPQPEARFTREDRKRVLRESLAGDPGVDTHQELAYARPGLPPSVMVKLRRGRYSVTSELDLHGLNVAMAREALDEFLDECRQLGHRCVRIVHGKGTRSGHNGPVLKPKVAGWLRRRDAVLAFSTALPRDGGGGALYVLLR